MKDVMILTHNMAQFRSKPVPPLTPKQQEWCANMWVRHFQEQGPMTPPGAVQTPLAPGQAQPAPAIAKPPSNVASQIQQTWQNLSQMMQKQNNAEIAKQLPGFIQMLTTWQRELQTSQPKPTS
jgi:hypothetical protein